MSFAFQWPRFSDQFHADAIQLLNNALNKGNKPPVITDKIEVVELEMGTQAPDLEIRDVGDMTMDHFRGIFRLTYDGDAHIVLRTKVQANPLNHKQREIHLMSGSQGMLAAKQPLVVPMLLRLSHFKLNSIVTLVVSKQKGITLVFKTDPLQNVDINSTFDSIAVIQKFIQREIEGQLRQMFREDLPGIIHRLSQQWVKAKVEAPYLNKNISPPSPPSSMHRTLSQGAIPNVTSPPIPHRPTMQRPLTDRAQTLSYAPSVLSSAVRPASSAPETPPRSLSYEDTPSSSSFPEIENFDPTYGLRPEGIPRNSTFTNFGRLFAHPKGLADLAEDAEEDSEFDDSRSYDMIDWDDSVSAFRPSPPSGSHETVEYEAIPAIGGGTITRPRVIHAQSPAPSPPTGYAASLGHPSLLSVLSARSDASLHTHASSSTVGPNPSRLGLGARTASSVSNPYFPYMPPPSLNSNGKAAAGSSSQYSHHTPPTPPLYRSPPRTLSSGGEKVTSSSSAMTRSLLTPPPSDGARSDHEGALSPKRVMDRRPSISSMSHQSTSSHHPSNDAGPSRILLRPSLSGAVSHLHTLSYSNHTLSPFTRSLQHFAVRSGPPRVSRATADAVAERQPVKAKRKRTFRLGGKPRNIPDDHEVSPPLGSPTRSDLSDASEMDRYFRHYEERPPSHLPESSTTHHRRPTYTHSH